jgi:hypothetical protein
VTSDETKKTGEGVIERLETGFNATYKRYEGGIESAGQ